MELREIEKLLEKYFDAETTTAEEQVLKTYFSMPGVAPHLEQYAPMFGYFKAQQQTHHFEKELPLKTEVNYTKWLSIAASIVLLFGMLTWFNFTGEAPQQDLGTYDDPEVAFRETQKALNMISKNVNVGVTSMEYIGEYEKTRKTIFKK